MSGVRANCRAVRSRENRARDKSTGWGGGGVGNGVKVKGKQGEESDVRRVCDQEKGWAMMSPGEQQGWTGSPGETRRS